MSKDKMKLEEAIKILTDDNKVYKLNKLLNDTLNIESPKYYQAIETVLEALKDKNTQIAFYKKIYEDLKNDFENYKNNKDINYLDGIHHKKLMEKSIGQIINKPEECWFDSVEVKMIIDDKLYNANNENDFVTLKNISDKEPNKCITVIAESPLSGTIYRYNNYGKKEWQLIGIMLGYA